MNGPEPNSVPLWPMAADSRGLGIEETIAACGGDTRAAIAALLVLVDHLKAELAERDGEIAAIAASVSRGYSRGRSDRMLPRPPPAGLDD